MTKPALILIDLQNDYYPGGLWPVDQIEPATQNAAMLLAHARAVGWHIVHIRHEILAPNAPFFRPGSDGAEIHADVAPNPGEPVILKHKPNSFLGTGLQAHLDEAGISDLIIVGAMSQMCIDATTRAASDLGYTVRVATDACGAKSLSFQGHAVAANDVHATMMASLDGSYAKVMDTRDIIAQTPA